jgi:hypothetical protein
MTGGLFHDVTMLAYGLHIGAPRLLRRSMHVTPVFFPPQLIPLGLLIFWMTRVRFPGWYRREAVARGQ